jgi:protein-disulfide isomerase
MSDRVRRAASASVTAAQLLLAAAVVLLLWRREVGGIEREPGPSRGGFTNVPNWEKFAARGNRVGPQTAAVTLVAFVDYQCPACRAFESALDSLSARRPGEVAVLYRHLPIGSHREAMSAAIASECAAQQGRFESMHRLMYARQDSLGVIPWGALAVRAGVTDRPRFESCMTDSSIRAVVMTDKEAARAAGARGTPTVLMNGVSFAGVPHPRVLDSLVAAAQTGKSPRPQWWWRLLSRH